MTVWIDRKPLQSSPGSSHPDGLKGELTGLGSQGVLALGIEEGLGLTLEDFTAFSSTQASHCEAEEQPSKDSEGKVPNFLGQTLQVSHQVS